MHKKQNLANSNVVSWIISLIVLCLWEILPYVLNIKRYLLPRPSQIIQEIFTNYSYLLQNMGVTFLEIVAGYLLANLFGLTIAITFTYSDKIKKGLFPYAIALKTVPIVAIAPLLVIWAGTGILSKVLMVALICFFPILINSVRGLNSIPPAQMDLFRSLNSTWWKTLTKLRIPNSLPHVFSALKISSTLAVVGAIVGEFTGSNGGLGFVIMTSSYQFETTTMFAAIILSSLLGILLFTFVSYLEKRIVFWK